MFSIEGATKDPHYLLNRMQLSCTQANISEVTTNIDGTMTTLKVNRSYCSGVKICAGDGCIYAVLMKQRINRCSCKGHDKMGLIPSGPCNCHLAYLYPLDEKNDGRRWIVALSAEKRGKLHNHPAPAEWKIPPNVLQDTTNAATKNIHLGPKDVQKGVGMNYRPMEVSLAAANIERVKVAVKKAIEKVDNEKVNPFKIIALFPSIKEYIDANSAGQLYSDAIDKSVGKYQLDSDNAYSSGCDRQFALLQSPFHYHLDLPFFNYMKEVIFYNISPLQRGLLQNPKIIKTHGCTGSMHRVSLNE